MSATMNGCTAPHATARVWYSISSRAGRVVEVDVASNQRSVSTREKNGRTTWFDVDRRHLFRGWFCSGFNRAAKERWSNFLRNWARSRALMPCCKKALSVTLNFVNLGTHYPTSSPGLSRRLYYAFECARPKATSGQGSSQVPASLH